MTEVIVVMHFAVFTRKEFPKEKNLQDDMLRYR